MHIHAYHYFINFKEMEKIIKQDGWVKSDIVGSHHHYEHPVKKGKVTIPFHRPNAQAAAILPTFTRTPLKTRLDF